jgi:uncharacterized protein YceH (UPF0502 family)
MNTLLSALEARIIGSLLEKQITTPDQYPLSLNALVNACNQKSNRDPMMKLDEATVQGTVDLLVKRHLIVERSGFGSRVPKYQQLFCNTEFGSLKFTAQETAIVCELLLRGPQTPGELRSRAARMAPVADVSEIEAALEALSARAEGAIVVRLPREAGRRDSCYAHLFGDLPFGTNNLNSSANRAGGIDAAGSPASTANTGSLRAAAAASVSTAEDSSAALAARVANLEAQVHELRRDLAALRQDSGA